VNVWFQVLVHLSYQQLFNRAHISSRLVYIPPSIVFFKAKTVIVGLDHIGIAVNKIDNVLPVYQQLLGLELKGVKEGKSQRVKAAIFAVGETNIELLEPLDKESPVSKFLEKRGQGMHHIALRVNNIEKMLQHLKAKGVILIDEKPRAGIEGSRIAFLHPKSTGDVLIELCEH